MRMKKEKKTINFFQSGWCLIIGFILAASGAVAIFISPAFKPDTALISGIGFACFICGGILIYKIFVNLPNTISRDTISKKPKQEGEENERI